MPDFTSDMVAQRAFVMRQSGATWDEIQELLVARSYVETAPSTDELRVMVHQYIVSMASYLGPSDREVAMGMELSRLDKLQAAVWDQALQGDLKALDSVLRIMAHRAKLTGLDQLSLHDKSTAAMVLIVGGDRRAYLEALDHGRAQLVAGSLPDDEDELEGEGLER